MNKLMKNSFLINHKYAPELNKIFINGKYELKASNIKSLEAFKCLFKPTVQYWKRIKVQVTHSLDEHKCCDKNYIFGAKSYNSILQSMRMIKERHNLHDAKIVILSIESVFI